jgi:acyl transferase domain-containing protein/3-hydroxymyristoyl/3-hydroxydecanoyl-(acyl carrier protein) dehydratase
LPAGLLAKGLGLGGGSYTLDAACASSLYALKLAADELLAGRADAMLAGGCSRPDCQYTQMGFAQLRALSVSGRCSPFDAAADGLMVGEGAGVFVLKRLSDALAHGDTIHAVIAGVGLSNDMHGNLLAPAKEGQLRAMRRAYERAGWQPHDVELIECHATGTAVGDAVEFESLRELWGESGWSAGQCAIGSVKSTVGHLLTGAGAAAVAKVLLAMKAATLPPQANFAQPASGLRYAGGPFRVLAKPERWERRTGARRAAASGFGFGGVNAHLLLEEWIEGSEQQAHARPSVGVNSPSPIAVVGLAAHFGPWDDARKFQEHVLRGEGVEPTPKVNGWGLAGEPCPPGFAIEELHIPIDRFRIPPKELEETLPQQLLMLQVAAAALDDSAGKASGSPRPAAAAEADKARDAGPAGKPPESDATTGVFVGLGLDANTMNFNLRWSVLASGGRQLPDAADEASPPLSANRTMGALGSIAASRIARAFHFGGPSHTVCSEEGSAARAVELGVRALQAGELDRALVGGVDLACDPRMVLPGGVRVPGEGAAAFVLKRLADAERDGDRVYAVIRGVGVADDFARALPRAVAEAGADFANAVPFDATSDVGETGAASAAASLAKACVALWQEVSPGNPPRYWLHDSERGPRRAAVTAHGADGSRFVILLEEHVKNADLAPSPGRAQPLGARDEAVFVVDGDSPARLLAGLDRLKAFASKHASRNVEAVARAWFRESPPVPGRKLAVSLVARSAAELAEQIAFAAENLRANPDAAFPAKINRSLRDRVFYSPKPLGPEAKVAFVFPGSGNQFDGMGRDLSPQWPEVLRRQQAENELLRSQFAPELFWDGVADEAPPRALMFGQVAAGALVSDIAASLGVRCDAMVGLSLGESAGLFGVRAWRSRDEMFRRMRESTLFVSDLAPPYNAARRHWGLPPGESVDWVSGVIAVPAHDIRRALRPELRAYLLIINTPGECVIGGLRGDVLKLAEAVGKPVTLLTGVTLAHCGVGRPVEVPYRELHTLPVVAPKGVTLYSAAWKKSYELSHRVCAESITAGLLNTIDVPAVITAAYRDGVRVFVEVGPGNSCVRAIGAILGDRPHLARAAHAARQDAVSQILRLVAHLAAERVPVDLGALYGRESPCVAHREPTPRTENDVVIPVGSRPTLRRSVANQVAASVFVPSIAPAIEASANVQVLTMQAQETFLRVNGKFTEAAAGLLRFQTQLLGEMTRRAGGVSPLIETIRGLTPPARQAHQDPPRSLTYEQCCEFAVGRVGDVLGPLFAEIDSFPTRVRLPDGPLQLVDRVTLIEGKPLSLTRGRVVTEHTVRADRWYLEAGRIPTAISVESGQADLFLSGFLGIDLRTRGLAVYRLLDAVVSFHRGLPKVGETIVYDIHIDEFVKQGDAWIFRFRFDGTVGGEPFITMRNGVAGFFTAEALAAGKGIVQTALDKKRMPGKRPDDWRDLAPQRQCSLTAERVAALRAGDLATAFGPDFAGLPLRAPATIPGGMLRLVDRVPLIDPIGGRFGLGLVRAEFDIHPDDWFLTCHFVDDMVMPGTLMYECCLHTLRVLLMRTGWVGEAGEVVCEPVPGVNSRLKCRGQVTAGTRTVTYEVTVKEMGYRPEPYCLADALMYADGRPIVEITNMSLRMSGLTREKLEATWASGGRKPTVRSEQPADAGRSPVLYDSAKILAFSNGKPSEAFGEPYKVFDKGRVIARLPGPPFQFLDRVTAVTGAPFVLKAGAACEAEYDVPDTAWYFAHNRSDRMPFSVLLEVALQPCGWLAAYCGSALTSPEDLSFRNLGGKATQFRPVTPKSGTLTTSVKLTSTSTSAGMIIQHYDMCVRDRLGDVYKGTTYFGFFSKPTLANQVGIRDAKVPWPTEAERSRAERGILPHGPPFPGPMLRMVDRIDAFVPDGGKRRLGLVVGKIAVNPEFWFFKAHFYQDPVWPGSLGLESFLQLLKYAAWKRWGEPRGKGWQAVALNRPHAWTYRGQVVPRDKEVSVVLEVTAVDDHNRRLTADGFLTVDGRVIYQMTDFSLE